MSRELWLRQLMYLSFSSCHDCFHSALVLICLLESPVPLVPSASAAFSKRYWLHLILFSKLGLANVSISEVPVSKITARLIYLLLAWGVPIALPSESIFFFLPEDGIIFFGIIALMVSRSPTHYILMRILPIIPPLTCLCVYIHPIISRHYDKSLKTAVETTQTAGLEKLLEKLLV